MQGVILPGHERVEIERFGLPEPGHGQALVRMKSSGLCVSDLRAIYHEHKGPGAERYQNVIACLEPTGQLEAVGPGASNFEAQVEGGSVTFEPNLLLLHKQLTLHGSWVCGLPETQQAYETFDAGRGRARS